MLSGVSLGGAVVGALAFVATAVTTIAMELVDRDNVRRKINSAVETAQGPPPTFADLKAMKATEQGELQLMMHVMTAFDQYAPGGPLHNIAQGGPVPVVDTAYLPD